MRSITIVLACVLALGIRADVKLLAGYSTAYGPDTFYFDDLALLDVKTWERNRIITADGIHEQLNPGDPWYNPDPRLFWFSVSASGDYMVGAIEAGTEAGTIQDYLFLMKTDGSSITLLDRSGAGIRTNAALSPDASQVAYTVDAIPHNHEPFFEGLMSMDTHGSQPVLLWQGQGHCSCPAFSPDGENLAFMHIISSVDDNGSLISVVCEIHLMSPDGSSHEILFSESNPLCWYRGLCWSSGGDTLLTMGVQRKGEGDKFDCRFCFVDTGTGEMEKTGFVNRDDLGNPCFTSDESGILVPVVGGIFRYDLQGNITDAWFDPAKGAVPCIHPLVSDRLTGIIPDCH